MVRIIITGFFVITFWFASFAQNADAVFPPVPEHEHLLKIDTVMNGYQGFTTVLTAADEQAKTDFLNTTGQVAALKSALASQQLDSVVTQVWDTTIHKVSNSLKIRFDTADEGRELVLRYYNWQADKASWKILQANYYFFDDAGTLLSTEFQEYVVSNYRRYIRTEYTYVGGLVRYALRKETIDEVDTWTDLDRTVYEYDTQKRLEKVSTQIWNTIGERWNTNYFLEYSFDSTGNLVAEKGYDYDSYEDIATQKSQLIYEYDANNRLFRITEYVKGWQEGQFVQDRKQENEYDTGSNLAASVYSDWDYDKNDWLPILKNNYDHSVSGNQLMLVTGQNWQSAWMDSLRSAYLADQFYTPDLIQNYHFLEAVVPLISVDGVVCERIETSFKIDASWHTGGGTNYYFSSIPVGVDSQPESMIRVYPNPVSDKLFVEIGTIDQLECRIFDISGREICSMPLIGREPLDLSTLKSGLYLMELCREGERIYSGKLIKK